MPKQPNILLIFPDQHRADVMGCAGNQAAQTPNLDALAGQGVRFGRCVTNSPLCMPARTSFISAQYVSEHGVWNNNVDGDAKGQSHVRTIRDAGYHTAVIGKTHLYTHGKKSTADHKNVLEDWGYADIHELTGPLASGVMDSPWTDFLQEKGLLTTWRDYLRGHRELMRTGAPWNEAPCALPSEYQLDAYTGWQAAKWIREYKGDKPFYYQVCFPGPHDPYDSPAEYRARFKLEDMPLGVTQAPREPMSPLVGTFRNLYLQRFNIDGWTTEQRRRMKLAYYAKVTLIDHYIGEIMRALKERGLLDNTWVIYTSDHGDFLAERCMIQKMMFFDEALAIPCIIRPPGGVKGWISDAMCDQLDVAATLVDIAAAPPLAKTDGRSLAPNVRAGRDERAAHTGKDYLFSEVMGFSMVRDERYKMSVSAADMTPVELYDMLGDPRELDNLVNDPMLEKVRQRLLEQLRTRLLSVRDEQKFKVYQSQSELRGRTPSNWP